MDVTGTQFDDLATRIQEVGASVSNLRAELNANLREVDTEVRASVRDLRTELNADIHKVDTKLDRKVTAGLWMLLWVYVGFMLGLVVAKAVAGAG